MFKGTDMELYIIKECKNNNETLSKVLAGGTGKNGLLYQMCLPNHSKHPKKSFSYSKRKRFRIKLQRIFRKLKCYVTKFGDPGCRNYSKNSIDSHCGSGKATQVLNLDEGCIYNTPVIDNDNFSVETKIIQVPSPSEDKGVVFAEEIEVNFNSEDLMHLASDAEDVNSNSAGKFQPITANIPKQFVDSLNSHVNKLHNLMEKLDKIVQKVDRIVKKVDKTVDKVHKVVEH